LKPRTILVAALAREIHPLVRGWKRESHASGVTVYSTEDAIAAFAGMGAARAELATSAALGLGPVRRIISVGFAGGLHAAMTGGFTRQIGEVIDAATGEVFKTERFGGPKPIADESVVLVTVSSVASPADKRRLRNQFSADLVDMEAATVARIAAAHGLPFSAIKAVSDEHDFDLPGMENFATAEGQFRELAFALHVAFRPALWRPALRMAQTSSTAAKNLCAELASLLAS
jgi:adenosylhomocysteine nucleosidase